MRLYRANVSEPNDAPTQIVSDRRKGRSRRWHYDLILFAVLLQIPSGVISLSDPLKPRRWRRHHTYVYAPKAAFPSACRKNVVLLRGNCVIKDIIIYSEGGESDHCSAFLKFAVGASSGGLMGSAPAGPCDDGARPDAALSKPGHDQLGNSGSALWAEGCESAAFRPDSYERLYHPDLSSVGVVRNSIGPGAPEKRDVAK